MQINENQSTTWKKGLWNGSFFLIALFPDHCLLVYFYVSKMRKFQPVSSVRYWEFTKVPNADAYASFILNENVKKSKNRNADDRKFVSCMDVQSPHTTHWFCFQK